MPRFDAVIFDMDGTLITQQIDFAAIRASLGAEPGTDILAAIADLPPGERHEAAEALLAHELEAAGDAALKDGARRTLAAISTAGLKTALLTRNAKQVMEMILQRFDLRFDLSWSREFGPIKPEPDGVLQACSELGAAVERTACVGDFHYDIVAANRAGAVSVLLADGALPDFADQADYVITALPQLLDILEL